MSGFTSDTQFVKLTAADAVYSKYRMAIVVYKFYTRMICVPICGFGDNGIKDKREDEQKELMQIRDEVPGQTYYNGRGGPGHPPNRCLRLILDRTTLKKPSWVHLAAAFSVDYQLNLEKVGRLQADSSNHLLKAIRIFAEPS